MESFDWMVLAPGHGGPPRAERVARPASSDPAAIELAQAVKAWWIEHHGDTTGPRGERNLYDCEPGFVIKAKAIIGDWALYGTAPAP